jgi:hypothetical protein
MLKLTPKKKEKRTAGMRAGMTRAGIAQAATKLWLSGGATNFSILALAKALDVAPATVSHPIIAADQHALFANAARFCP